MIFFHTPKFAKLAKILKFSIGQNLLCHFPFFSAAAWNPFSPASRRPHESCYRNLITQRPDETKVTPCGTRTRNLRIRSPTPCPLGQGGHGKMLAILRMRNCGFNLAGVHMAMLPGAQRDRACVQTATGAFRLTPNHPERRLFQSRQYNKPCRQHNPSNQGSSCHFMFGARAAKTQPVGLVSQLNPTLSTLNVFPSPFSSSLNVEPARLNSWPTVEYFPTCSCNCKCQMLYGHAMRCAMAVLE